MENPKLSPLSGEVRPQSRVGDAASIRRTQALFKSMTSDYLLREQFVTDPSQVAAEYVAGERLPDERAEVANVFLYSVLSSPSLVAWLRENAVEQGGRIKPDEEFLADLAPAIARGGDEQVVSSLILGALSDQPALNVEVGLLQNLFAGLGTAAAGTEMSTGTSTEKTPGTGGTTEMSTGIASRLEREAATEMTPGTATTEISPATAGTEKTPGTAGTEKSGWEGRGLIAEIVLEALVDFSAQLRADGSLDAALRGAGRGPSW